MKLLHAADFHLDAPFAALSPEKAALRREEGRALLGRLAHLASRHGADLVLLAGDLFDGQTVYRETLDALTQALGEIPCPVFIAPGNHDPFTPASPYAALTWPENVTIFTSEEVFSKPLPQLGCVVHGVGFCHSRVDIDLLAGFQAPHDGLLHIGVVHGDVCKGNSLYNPMGENTLFSSHLDYLALGHIHTPSGLQKTGETFWAYPGCPEGHGFDELGERGCLLLEVDKSGTRAEFLPLSTRSYLEVPVDVTGKQVLAAAREALAAQRPQDCVKLILTGQTDEVFTPDSLEGKLAGQVFALRVKDRTRPQIDLARRAREDTLTGAFLKAMGRCDQPQAQLALRFGLAALEQGEDCRP